MDFSTNNIGGCDNIQYRPCRADIFPYTPSQRISRGVILLVLKSNIRPLRGVVYWISVLTLSHLSCKIHRPPVTKQYWPAYIIMTYRLFFALVEYEWTPIKSVGSVWKMTLCGAVMDRMDLLIDVHGLHGAVMASHFLRK